MLGVGNGVTAKGYEINLIIDIFYVIVVVVISRIYTIVKTLHIIYLKWVYFIILKLYLNKVYFKSVTENVRKSEDIGYREGPLEVASQEIILAYFFSSNTL